MLNISIVLATYNGMPWISEQFKSLLDQTTPPAEIIVSDDGSTDGTIDEIRRLALETSIPVRVIENSSRLGWRKNFITAAQHASGDLIGFCDQDDVWAPHKLSTICERYRDSYSFMFHGAELIDATGRRIGALDKGPGHRRVYAQLSVPYWKIPLGFTTVFRRDLLQYHELWKSSVDQVDPTERASHDQWYYFLATVFGEVCFIPDELASYRLHDRNTMGHRSGRMSLSDLFLAARSTEDKCRRKALVLRNRLSLLSEEQFADANVVRAREALSHAIGLNDARLDMLTSRFLPTRVLKLMAVLRRYSYSGGHLPEGNQELVRDLVAILIFTVVPTRKRQDLHSR